MNLAHLSRLFHTIRHLRSVQVSNRIRRRLFPTRLRAIEAPPKRPGGGRWVAPSQRPAVLCGPAEIRIFGQRVGLGTAKDWNQRQLGHLEQYNLHYFDDLTAVGADQRTPWHLQLVDRWIQENPLGEGVGWEPYPLSLRIVNWIKWALNGQTLSPPQLQSLATQTQALHGQLEYHLLGNHLLANAKALVFAGAFFQGPVADRWMRLGGGLMQQQIAEQILTDGGHFELSPMYHSIILDDLLDLLNLARAYPDVAELAWARQLPETVFPMRRWLAAMCHPDGQIAFFNDAAFEIAPSPAELEGYASRLGLSPCPTIADGITHLEASGYVRLQQDTAVLLIDVGRLGPDYQPGHAHADTLSCEFSLQGRRLIVNSGTSCYGISDERLRQRSTPAHTALVVDGENSSEVWSGFRVARRAEPFDLEMTQVGEELIVRCAHDGYQRLPGRVTHRRRWSLQPACLTVQDRLDGRPRSAIARFFLAPGVQVVTGADSRNFTVTGTGVTSQWTFTSGRVRCVPASYHPRFGSEVVPNQCFESQLDGSRHALVVQWPELDLPKTKP